MKNNEIRWITKPEVKPDGLQIQILANTYDGIRGINIREMQTETMVFRQIFVSKVELQVLTTELLKMLKEVEDEEKGKGGDKNDMEICPRCNGEGRVKGAKGYSDCIVCKGEGKLFTWELEEYNKREKERFRGHPSDDCHTYD